MSAEKMYDDAYVKTVEQLELVKASLVDRAGHVVRITAMVGGREAVKGMFDALMDRGHRGTLVQALNSPALDNWVRELLETLLYGNGPRSLPAVLAKQLH